MFDVASSFRAAILAAGLQPPDFVAPGKVYRFPGHGKGPGNRAGWCLLFDDGLGGCFGDWSTGDLSSWQAPRNMPFSQAERTAFGRNMQIASARVAAERAARHANAADRASKIWNAATSAPFNNPYLTHKHIQPHGARVYAGSLVLPVTDFAQRLTSLQFIASDGSKRLLSGGRKAGCFIHVAGEMANPSRVIICEGWATGCSLAEFEPFALVLAAIDAGNLKAVAMSARQRWATAQLLIAGDDDRLTPGNPGATKARHAAIASDALLALPQWPEGTPDTLTDFNDLAIWLSGGGT